MHKITSIPITLFALSLSASALSASVITSGTITVVAGLGSPNTFSLSGDGFVVTGAFASDNLAVQRACFGCRPGDVVYVGGTVVNPFTFVLGTATVGASVFPEINWGADNSFTPAGPDDFHVNGVSFLMGDLPGIYQTPFSFTGDLCGTLYQSVPFGGTVPCTVTLANLTGSGIATLKMTPGTPYPNGTPSFYTEQMTFTFSNTEAVGVVANPEPSTYLLLTTAVLMGQWWRKRAHR